MRWINQNCSMYSAVIKVLNAISLVFFTYHVYERGTAKCTSNSRLKGMGPFPGHLVHEKAFHGFLSMSLC